MYFFHSGIVYENFCFKTKFCLPEHHWLYLALTADKRQRKFYNFEEGSLKFDFHVQLFLFLFFLLFVFKVSENSIKFVHKYMYIDPKGIWIHTHIHTFGQTNPHLILSLTSTCPSKSFNVLHLDCRPSVNKLANYNFNIKRNSYLL